MRDPQKRSNYDQFGDAAEKFSGFGNFGGFEGFSHNEFDFGDIFSGFGGGDFSDFFSGMFRGSRARGPQRGEDIAVNLGISFEEAAFGVEKEIEIERREVCSTCSGEGTTKKSGKKTCSTCRGSGMQQTVRRTFLGTIATSTTCKKCGGAGEEITDPCNNCGGKKIVRNRKKIKVKIPAGINAGNNIRLSGEGHTGGSGAGEGDLYLVILIEPHKIFKRDKTDIFMEMPVSFSEAALGAEIEVPTLRKTAKIKIPSGTQTDTIFRLKEQGIKELNGNHVGDEYIKVIVKTPEKLSKKQKEILEEFAQTEGNDIRKTGFFDGIKKHFK